MEKSPREKKDEFLGKGLSEKLKEWIDDYPNYYPRDFRFSFKEVIEKDIPAILKELKGVSNYHVKGFAGQDQWAEIPWVGIEEDSGLALAYLLAKDAQVLYLAITYQEEGVGVGTLSQKVEDLREKEPSDQFDTLKSDIYLPNPALVAGIVYYQMYSEPLPDDQTLVSEFEAFLALFEKIGTHFNLKQTEIIDQASDLEDQVQDHINDQQINEEIILKEEQKIEEKNQALEELVNIDLQDDKVKDKLANKEKVNKERVNEENKDFPEVAKKQEIELEKNMTQAMVQKSVSPAINVQSDLEREDSDDEKDYFLKMTFPKHQKKDREVPISLKMIAGKMAKQGFYFPNSLIFNYYLSLKAKPFVLLTGRLGMGKTTFPRLFAETIGASYENGRYERILVGKEWQEQKSVFRKTGHPFSPTALLQMFKKAFINPEKPHFLLLDELDYVSSTQVYRLLIESINGRDEPILNKDDFKDDQVAFREYGNLIFPENLYIIGTLNQGHQKHLAAELVDCGNIIRMPEVEIKTPFETGDFRDEENWNNSRFKMKSPSPKLPEVIEKLMQYLEDIQKLLSRYNCPMAYRQKNELLAYGINNGIEALLSEEEVIDYGICQRILPIIENQNLASEKLYRELCLYCIQAKPFGHKKNQLMNLATGDFCEIMASWWGQGYFFLPLSGKALIVLLEGFNSDKAIKDFL